MSLEQVPAGTLLPESGPSPKPARPRLGWSASLTDLWFGEFGQGRVWIPTVRCHRYACIRHTPSLYHLR